MRKLLPVLLLFGAALTAAEPILNRESLPRVAPTEPTNALSTFQVKPGFRLDLVAAEPLVVDPIAMSFDENGRLYVIEMRDYSERRDERLGRVRLLEDTDGNGVFDKSTVFADGFPWPTAIICFDGGVFVGATPEILYLKDTNGDNVADERKVIFSGFAETGERLNVQGLMNSFNWTLDNRIHGAAGLMGGRIRSPNGSVLEVRGKDFSFDPRNPSDIRAESGGGQHGLTFTDEGRKLICHNSAHIKLVMYEDRFRNRNPYYSMPPPVIDIAADGAAAEVYRLSPVEPWRVLRTAWRVAGKVSGPIEGGGRASGYFTSATGITVYRGDAFGEDFRGDAFIADVGSNLIHRKKLYPKGLELEARRPDEEQKVEFIASKDVWFRPVQFANAPDGCLYVADMYREVVEHPWSLPEAIKQHLDLNSGNDRGRIYRIAPNSFKSPRPPTLGKRSTGELVRLLEHPNGWTRDTAARLLYERQDKSSIADLHDLAAQSKTPLGRLHALSVLAGQKALSPSILIRALDDADAVVREHAVRLMGSQTPKQQLNRLARDASNRVRFQVALAAEQPLPFPDSDFGDRWMRAAILGSYSTSEKALGALAGSNLHRELKLELAEIVGAANKDDHPKRVAELAENDLLLALGLARGLARAKSTLDRLGPVGEHLLHFAAESDRTEEAIELLGYSSYAKAGSTLLGTLRSGQSQRLRTAALTALGRFPDPDVGRELVKIWPTLTPQLRSEGLSVLLARPERALALLHAISKGTLAREEMSSLQIQHLLTHKDSQVRELAMKTLGQRNPAKRTDVIERFREALTLTGDKFKGKKAFQERCASCHQLGNEGHPLGPDLITVKTAGKEKLLESILDPDREVLPQYVAHGVETETGNSYLGVISREDANVVTLREAFGKETTIPRTTIRKIQSQRQSIMPEGLEAGMTSQDMADLLEFVTTFNNP